VRQESLARRHVASDSTGRRSTAAGIHSMGALGNGK